jgi:hypothetical protein
VTFLYREGWAELPKPEPCAPPPPVGDLIDEQG